MSFLFTWARSFLDAIGLTGLFRKRAHILFLGLDNAGKTSLLEMMSKRRTTLHEPTRHPQNGRLLVGNVQFDTHDMGGHAAARRLWKRYTTDVSGIVFLFDLTDRARFEEAAEELRELMMIEDIDKVPFLVLGNKVDDDSAVKDIEVFRSISGVHPDDPRTFTALCSATHDSGFAAGFEWLASRMQ